MTTVGILGAGQLGRMLALAGYPLGMRFRFFDPLKGFTDGSLAPQWMGDYADRKALDRFAEGLDVITYEFENVPVQAAYVLEKSISVFPPPPALEKAQDRWIEKSFFRELGLPTAEFTAVNSLTDLEAAVRRIGFPALLKTRRLGYDGKGQMPLHSLDDVGAAWNALGGVPLILEEMISFERELSIIGVRGRSGQTVFYPLIENHHRDGILRLSISPLIHEHQAVNGNLQEKAESYMRAIMSALNYVGVLAVEMFEMEGWLFLNEMAPRVHNSGHWTIDGAVTSQFENHLRAVCGLPLGDTSPLGACAMINFIGELPESVPVLKNPGSHLHLYDKAPRPGRKLGHINIVANGPEELQDKIRLVQGLIAEAVY